MKSNTVPDPKKSHNSAGSDSKNPDPEQHWSLFKLDMFHFWNIFIRKS